MAYKALEDVARAFGFLSDKNYLRDLERKGAGVKALVLERLKKRGIRI